MTQLNQYNASDNDAEYFPSDPVAFKAAAEVKMAIRAARHILLNTRVQDFNGADVVATAALILEHQRKLEKRC